MPENHFNIKVLADAYPEEGKLYLFDTNIWLMIINPPTELKKNEKEYVDFFDAIINLSLNDRCRRKPHIFINSLILSEVYNVFVKINCKAYNDSGGSDLTPKEYRNTGDYKQNLDSFRSDISAYRPYLIADDSFNPDALEVLDDLGTHSDFNDHLYYHLALKHGLAIVTNDGDFVYQQVEIISNNYRITKNK